MSTWLNKERRFRGQMVNGTKTCPVHITLKNDLETHFYIPHSELLEDRVPTCVVGASTDWTIQISNFTKRNIKFGSNSRKPHLRNCVNVTLKPNTCTFTSRKHSSETPDEWGILLYPEKQNNSLYHLIHEGPEFGKPTLPPFLSFEDNCLYFKNRPSWSFEEIQKRIEIITDGLSLFAGIPLTHKIIIGRKNRKVIYMLFHVKSDQHVLHCPHRYTGHAALRDKRNKLFSFPSFIDKINAIADDPKMRKTHVILRYFKIFYSQYFYEARMAFSFQLMESLAKYKGFTKPVNNKKIDELREKLCANCYSIVESHLLRSRIDESKFDELLTRSIDAFNETALLKNNFTFAPEVIKELSRLYRNRFFHGDYFDDMNELQKALDKVPNDFRRDLPIVLQAIMSILSANIIFGIDFSLLTGKKSLAN